MTLRELYWFIDELDARTKVEVRGAKSGKMLFRGTFDELMEENSYRNPEMTVKSFSVSNVWKTIKDCTIRVEE